MRVAWQGQSWLLRLLVRQMPPRSPEGPYKPRKQLEPGKGDNPGGSFDAFRALVALTVLCSTRLLGKSKWRNEAMKKTGYEQ
jgi:hypothetical protein